MWFCVKNTPKKIGTPLHIIRSVDINIGYGYGQLRPDGSRGGNAETRQMAIAVMKINGMSGQQV